MMIAASKSRAWTGSIVALSIHLALLALVLRDRPSIHGDEPRRIGELVFIQPPAPLLMPRPENKSPRAARPNLDPLPSRPPRAPTAPASEPPQPAMPATPAPEPFDTPRQLDMDALVKQAGRADRDARPAGENTQYGPVPDSMRSVLSKAFTEAKLAVPLKWYEAARIELFSAPNDPKKIYQVKTAFGTYCLFYPDPRKIEGGAQAMQPKAGNCPVRF